MSYFPPDIGIYIPEPDLNDELIVALGTRPDSGWPEFTTLGDIADFIAATTPVPPSSGVASITGTFTSDGPFDTQLPAAGLITAATVVSGTSAGVTISLGTTLGGTDVLGSVVVPGSVPTGVQGASFSSFIFPTDQTIYVHSASWTTASITITLWLFGPPGAGTLLFNNGGLLVTTDQTWPTDSSGAPGSLWSNGGGVGLAGIVSVVPGATPLAGPPITFGQITSTQLRALGGRTLLAADPSPGSQQLYAADNQILVA